MRSDTKFILAVVLLFALGAVLYQLTGVAWFLIAGIAVLGVSGVLASALGQAAVGDDGGDT